MSTTATPARRTASALDLHTLLLKNRRKLCSLPCPPSFGIELWQARPVAYWKCSSRAPQQRWRNFAEGFFEASSDISQCQSQWPIPPCPSSVSLEWSGDRAEPEAPVLMLCMLEGRRHPSTQQRPLSAGDQGWNSPRRPSLRRLSALSFPLSWKQCPGQPLSFRHSAMPCSSLSPPACPDTHASFPPAAGAGSASQLPAQAGTWRLKLLSGGTLSDLVSSFTLSGPTLQAQPHHMSLSQAWLTPFLDTFLGWANATAVRPPLELWDNTDKFLCAFHPQSRSFPEWALLGRRATMDAGRCLLPLYARTLLETSLVAEISPVL